MDTTRPTIFAKRRRPLGENDVSVRVSVRDAEAYRPGRNAQQAVIEENSCSVATRKSLTPTSRTISGASPMPNSCNR
jgi:hypothetical protein